MASTASTSSPAASTNQTSDATTSAESSPLIEAMESLLENFGDRLYKKISADMDVKLVKLETKINTRMDKIEAKVDKLETKVDALETKVDKLDAKFEKRFEAIDKRFEAIEKRGRKIELALDSISARVDLVRQDVSQAMEAAVIAMTRIEALEDKVNSIQSCRCAGNPTTAKSTHLAVPRR